MKKTETGNLFAITPTCNPPAKLVMSKPDNVLDLENPPQFDPDIWIGKGRTYPAKREDVPRELSLYRAVENF